MIPRRGVLKAGLASSVGLFAWGRGTRTARASSRAVRFIPEGGLVNLDPVNSGNSITRNHGFLVFDTLFGADENLAPRPQMAEGYELSDDKLVWRIRLRDGLRFHDGTPVRAADCAASVARWTKRDPMGQQLAKRLDGMSALDDRSFEIRLKRPFSLLLTALGKPTPTVCFIMPERLASTEVTKPITEPVGSGPFRFLQDEFVKGKVAAYARFEGYVPRQEPPSLVAGGKKVNVDRVEWRMISGPEAAAEALRSTKVDWWQLPEFEQVQELAHADGVAIQPATRFGEMQILRFNFLHPPFDKPELRRAVLKVVDQEACMRQAFGDDRSFWRAGVGVFTPDTPAASDAGMELLTGPRDWDGAKRLVADHYKGERVVILAAQDDAAKRGCNGYARDLLTKLGFKVDYITGEFEELAKPRASMEPPDKGGWSVFCTGWDGFKLSDPSAHNPLQGNGRSAWFGWPTVPGLEELRARWYDAPDMDARRKITEEIQKVALDEVVFIPLGEFNTPTARRENLTGVRGVPLPLFWGIDGVS